MTLMERRRGMMMVTGDGGSRVKTVSGSFTVSSGYLTQKQITHNLGTNKVFGMIWVEPDANNEVVTTSGYQVIFGTFCTYQKFNEVLYGATLVCNYTSHETKTYTIPSNDIAGGLLRKTKWVTDKAGTTGQAVNNIWATSETENDLTIHTDQNNTYMRAGTYLWQVWALE